MQSSMWKLLTAVGIIGIGTLVVLEVQSRLPVASQASRTASSGDNAGTNQVAGADVVPDATTELDKMLSGAEAFDDTQFTLNEPNASSESASQSASTDDQRYIGVAPVNRTVLKDSLVDDNNPFNRDSASGGEPEPENAPTETITPVRPLAAIQPASFAATPTQTQSNDSSPTTTSSTIFFNANGNQDLAAATQASKSAGAQTNAATTTSVQEFSNSRTASANNTGIAKTQIDEATPDLFMPDPASEQGRSDNPGIPNKLPEIDSPLMDTPGFESDSQPSFDFTPEPATPTNPSPGSGLPDLDLGNNNELPASPANDENTRFFEPDLPVPTPPADNGGSRPDSRPNFPPAFELEPVPELAPPRTVPRPTTHSDPRPTPRNSGTDDFPTPTYPNPGSRPDASNSPFETGPNGRNEFPDALDLPAISDRPPRSTPNPDQRDPASASPDTSDRSMSEVMRPQLSIRKRAPDRATVGVPHEYTILVSNEGDSAAYDVIVDDDLGDGAKLEFSKPTAEFDRVSGKLKWTISELAPRAKQEILVRITPTGEGTLDGVATVRFKAQVKSATVITAPKITLEVTGPPEVKVGDEVQLHYLVRNNGTGDATNVILRSVLPPGLKHSEGGDLEYEIENLRAGDREEIDLTVVAAEPGSFRTVSEVTMSGVSADRTNTEVVIVGSQLTIQRLGPDRRFVGRTATFQNIVTNDTNFEASNAVVTEQVPEGMRFISADNGGEYNPQTGQIRWELSRLLPHKQTVLEVELEAQTAGSQQTIVEIVENAGFRTQAMENTVVTVEDYQNMTADISRQDAPVAIGETFGFTITIENRGTAVARGVEMVVNVPSEISVKAAGTRTNPARRVGNSVHYALVEAIQPGEKMAFELKLQGERPARNALVRASLKYEHLTEPLIVTESVTVFEDQP